jgi:hypothetical protein
MRNVLGFKSDLFYQGPFGGGYPPATAFAVTGCRCDGTAAPTAAGGAAGAECGRERSASTSQALRAAMNTNPRLRCSSRRGTTIVSIVYDIEYAVKHLPPDLARRVTVHSYPGGHAATPTQFDTVSRGRRGQFQAATSRDASRA